LPRASIRPEAQLQVKWDLSKSVTGRSLVPGCAPIPPLSKDRVFDQAKVTLVARLMGRQAGRYGELSGDLRPVSLRISSR